VQQLHQSASSSVQILCGTGCTERSSGNQEFQACDVFIALGGNFVAAVPDADVVKPAMRRLKLTVGINTKLNRGHVVHGQEALILPCLARSGIDIQATGRQSITVEDSMTHWSSSNRSPQEAMRADPRAASR
jgi:anaerobic selenocysteine-containing dehydrogenase